MGKVRKMDIREKLAKREAEKYPYFKVWDRLEDADKVPFLEDAEELLALIKEVGWIDSREVYDQTVRAKKPGWVICEKLLKSC